MGFDISNWENKINNKDPIVRQTFAEYLGRQRNVKEAPEFLERLLEDKEYFVRYGALEALGNVGSEKQFASVMKLLNDKNELVRIEAVETIYCLGKEKALDYLIEKLNDKSKLVRSYAAVYIGEIGKKSSIKYLEKALKKERSSRAKVGLIGGLYLLGQDEKLFELLSLLESRLFTIRSSIEDALNYLPFKKNHIGFVIEALKKAIDIEPNIGVKSDMKKTLLKLEKKTSKNKISINKLKNRCIK